jgi:thiol-disulfide isomerase/thioredoxin
LSRSQWVAVAIGLIAVAGLVAANLDDSPDATMEGDNSAAEGTPEETAPAPTTSLPEAPPFLGTAGDLVDLDGWLQTEAAQFSDFDGTVRVVQFWTFGCINCRNTLENLRALYDEFEPRGLEVIGVHAPEFDFEADPAAIAQAAIDLDVNWPIALDTDKTNFRAWQPGRRFWPRTFVLDRDGNIRFDRIGEGAYDQLNATVAWLIENDRA